MRFGFPCMAALSAALLRQAVAQETASPTYPAIDVEYEFPSSAFLGRSGPASQDADGMLSFKRRVEDLSKRIHSSEDLLGAFVSEANASLSELLPLVQGLSAVSLRGRPGAVADPAFPPGVVGILRDVSSRFDEIDGLHVDDSQVLSGLKQDTLQSVAAGLAEVSDMERIADIAYVLARAKARKLRFTGGCPRAMHGCPLGWTAQGDTCTPPSDYEGLCGEVAVSQMSASDKEHFAWKCGASWPCETCRTHFGGCPTGWVENAGLCVAPPEYDGICSPVMDFSVFSAPRLAEWSAMCSARWPCAA